MELHAVAEMQDDDLAAVFHLIALNEQRNRGVLRIERIQPLEDMLRDHRGQIGRHHMLVERRRLVDHRHPQNAALCRSGRRRTADQHETHACRQKNQQLPSLHTLHSPFYCLNPSPYRGTRIARLPCAGEKTCQETGGIRYSPSRIPAFPGRVR